MTHFEQELADLKDKLLTMASLAESAVNKAIQALMERDDDLASAVKEEDSAIDRLEMELDGMAIDLLAKAPLASDLRLITVVMKISHDLERVGDEATTIARRSLAIRKRPAPSSRATRRWTGPTNNCITNCPITWFNSPP